jgi:phytoene dehydrogenase-like protein
VIFTDKRWEAFPEDVMKALAEVAPDLAERIIVGHRVTSQGWFDRDEFALVHRATRLVNERQGRRTNPCEDCAWRAYKAQVKDETGRLVVDCAHRS